MWCDAALSPLAWKKMMEVAIREDFRERLIRETHAEVDKIRAERGLPRFDWENRKVFKRRAASNNG